MKRIVNKPPVLLMVLTLPGCCAAHAEPVETLVGSPKAHRTVGEVTLCLMNGSDIASLRAAWPEQISCSAHILFCIGTDMNGSSQSSGGNEQEALR